MLNLYPKKYKPDFVFHGLFLLRMPQTIHDYPLARDIQDPDALAKKSDALFQSHQSSLVKILLSDDPLTTIQAICPPQQRVHSNSAYSTSSGCSITCQFH